MNRIRRHHPGILGVVLTAVLCSTPPAFAQSSSPAAAQPDTVPVGERMWIASKIYSTVLAYFGHWEGVPDLDLDQAFREYQEAALSAPSRFEFDLATMAFMARLENGHSGFTDRWLFDVGGGPVGFTARRANGDWVVHTSRLESLDPGDEIRAIDGTPVETFVQNLLQFVGASSERSGIRRLWFQSYLFPGTFEVELADGRSVTIDRERQKLAPTTRRAYEESIREDGTAYLYIPSFGESDMEERAVKFVRANARAPALIIDVRANGGGTTPTALIEALMDRPYRGFTESTAVTYGLFEAYAKISRDAPAGSFTDYVRGYLNALEGLGRAQIHMPGPLVQPRDPAYSGRLIVLIDGGCASACEDFVMPLRTSDRATVIGERTSGSTGQPYMHDFGNMMSFRVSTKRVYFPDGAQFEGVGIEPHIEITPTAEDLKTGRDPVLERAEALAREPAR